MKFVSLLLAVVLAVGAPGLLAAEPRAPAKAAAKPAAAKPKPAAKKAASPPRKPAAKPKRARSSAQSCRNVRIKTASGGYRTVRRCTTGGAAGSAAALTGGAATPVDAGRPAELRARTIPDRAYAVDGHTFFHHGRKYRIVGLDENLVPSGNDLAKQRLQLALDSGSLSVEPESVDESGTVSARVMVAGKDLATVLNAR